MNNLTVLDFFCGAGGFSQGFYQMGFNILYGYDSWEPAVKTFNHNYNTTCEKKNILDFDDLNEILKIPDSDIIVGSPPCVSFSSSNKSGKADKSLGLKLTEAYLRIIAVKKHQKGSILKAWFMENVSNTKKYLNDVYTFNDLEIGEWATKIGKSPNDIAIDITEKKEILNAADYGSFQARKRLIVGEIILENKFIIPKPSHKKPNKKSTLPNHKPLIELKKELKSPFERKNDKLIIKDPNYGFKLPQDNLTDHFYDTGIYEVEVRFSKHWKVNHPYMGKMSFPEDEENSSRTITATRIANSRESIIYRSEIERKGDGEFRLPTIREAATIMGFPITYQFKGSENTKWRLVGNAVCASVGKALAETVLISLGIKVPKNLYISKEINLKGVKNLNTFSEKEFNNPPIKNKGAKCRWHPFKDGNLTVTLSNFVIDKDKKSRTEWITSIQYGTGKGYPSQLIEEGKYLDFQNIISKQKKEKNFSNS